MVKRRSQQAADKEPKDPRVDRVHADTFLYKRAQRGDVEAFGRLVERHSREVWRLVWRIVRDADQARDVAQDVFLKAWETIHRFQGKSSFRTYLMQIAHNEAINWARRVSRHTTVSLDGPLVAGGGELNLCSSTSPADVVLETQEQLQLLRRCMETLPPLMRAALILYCVENIPYGDLADLFGISEGTVRSRVSKARAALRRCMGTS